MGTGTTSRVPTRLAFQRILQLSCFLVLGLLPDSCKAAQEVYGNILDQNRGSSEEIFKLSGSQLNDEAKQNFQTWLAYIHATSDPENEPRVDSYKVDDLQTTSSVSLGEDKGKFKPKKTIVVAQDGSGDFMTIQAAVDSLPTVNHERVLIKIKAGVYREKVKISIKRRYITMEGEAPADGSTSLRTIITYNSTAADLGSNGLLLKTFGSATFAVNAKYFIARYISFVNTAPTPKPGAVGGQAVALRVSGDRAAFYSCSFLGEQDTLYDHKGRHFFHQCFVQGTVDFIFGNGRSLYMRSHLHSLPNNGVPGALTAQKRNTSSLNTGFSFVNSLITGFGSAYLGRAWGNDSRVVFAETFMSKVVIPDGWNNWGIPDREKTVFYAEYNCTGPGANSTGRVQWAQQLTYEQAKPFLSIRFINGKKWLQNPTSLEKEDRQQIPAGQDPSDLAPSSLPEWEPTPGAPATAPSSFPFPWWKLTPTPTPSTIPFPWWQLAPTPAPESDSSAPAPSTIPFPFPWWKLTPAPAPDSGSPSTSPFPFPWWTPGLAPDSDPSSTPFPWWKLAPTPAPESGSTIPFPWWKLTPASAPDSGSPSTSPFPFPWWTPGLAPDSDPSSTPFPWWQLAPTPAPESGSTIPFPWWKLTPAPAPDSGSPSTSPFPFPWWTPGLAPASDPSSTPFPWWQLAPTPAPESGSTIPFPWWKLTPAPAPDSGSPSTSPFPFPWWTPGLAPDSDPSWTPFPWWQLAPTPAPESGSTIPFPFPWWKLTPASAPDAGSPSTSPFPFPWWTPGLAPDSDPSSSPFPWSQLAPIPASESG